MVGAVCPSPSPHSQCPSHPSPCPYLLAFSTLLAPRSAPITPCFRVTRPRRRAAMSAADSAAAGSVGTRALLLQFAGWILHFLFVSPACFSGTVLAFLFIPTVACSLARPLMQRSVCSRPAASGRTIFSLLDLACSAGSSRTCGNRFPLIIREI
jgi:hypothetical protein